MSVIWESLVILMVFELLIVCLSVFPPPGPAAPVFPPGNISPHPFMEIIEYQLGNNIYTGHEGGRFKDFLYSLFRILSEYYKGNYKGSSRSNKTPADGFKDASCGAVFTFSHISLCGHGFILRDNNITKKAYVKACNP